MVGDRSTTDVAKLRTPNGRDDKKFVKIDVFVNHKVEINETLPTACDPEFAGSFAQVPHSYHKGGMLMPSAARFRLNQLSTLISQDLTSSVIRRDIVYLLSDSFDPLHLSHKFLSEIKGVVFAANMSKKRSGWFSTAKGVFEPLNKDFNDKVFAG
ncbi:putative domain, di-copper centre, Polyphenol oxidase [Artemisia annua]|uniref:Putative domain, di-copper centre, Polyphenol oxidase n=1 Tax=Artemisia annua TaxID=35608 RepID=A0A2U1N3W3_ARTAN|nr:putative domain, di-copper centre, Polyphenol oxidase [Artemisia annua]